MYVRITFNGKTIKISLKYKIALNKWNDKTGMVRNKSDEGKSLNNFMKQTRHG